ncbi:MAG TPA: NUDIX domain-containing protein [Thermomicrobiales bacterium]|jgi:8-oxo-dGTP diphosphatase
MASKHEQFTVRGRYTVIPRTLVFLRNGGDVLLLKGAPTKRLWAGRYNGLGGHVEADETIMAAALREVREEVGLPAAQLTDFALRALVNIAGAPSGVLLCVFTGWTRTRDVHGSVEGMPEWMSLQSLGNLDLVDGDRLLPRLLHEAGIAFGHQRYDAEGQVASFVLE